MSPLTAVVTLIAAVVYMIYRHTNKGNTKRKEPPQVLGWRNYVNFIQSAADNNLHGLAMHWARDYGDIFKFNILGFNMVFINNSQLIRKILNDNDYKDLTSDRPYTFIGRYGLYGEDSVSFNSSSILQRKRRKAFHQAIKFYGEGVVNIESIIMSILNDEIEHFAKQEIVDISKDISRIVLRIVDHLFVGYKPDGAKYRVKCLYEFEDAFNTMFIYGNEAFLQPFPFLRFVPSKFKRLYDRLISSRTVLEDVYLNDKEAILKDTDCGLVGELVRVQKENGTFLFPDTTIKSILAEATVAGYLTTSSMLSMVIILCIKFPEIQQRLYDEIKTVVSSESPCLRRHRHYMPFMESFILETLRYSSSAPFLLYHACREDIQFENYFIPKDSILIMNAWYSQRHPKVWDDPWAFKADRFLDKEGNLLPADSPMRLNLVPFGTGKRSCPGEAFARSRMFLILVSLIGNFKFFKAQDCELPSLDPRTWKPGAVVGPDDFRCRIEMRSIEERLNTSLFPKAT